MNTDRNRARLRRTAWITALVVIVTAGAYVITGPAKSGTAATTPPRGITCNTVSAAELGACVSKMLTDPNGAYSPDHVYTAAEKQPVYAPRKIAAATAADVGTWSVVADCTVNNSKVNPIHSSVTKTGKVLMTAGSGYSRDNFEQKVFKTWIYDPATPGTCPREIPMPKDVDLFCSGHTLLPDGRVLFFGGTAHYADASKYYTGIRETFAFDDVTETFVPTGKMNVARWYPNGPVNSAGNPVVVSGLDDAGKVTSTNEVFNATTGLWSKLPGNRIFPLYAGMVLQKNGTLCYLGANMGGKAGAVPGCWNWVNNGWAGIPGLLYPDCRDQANTLLLYPAQAQKAMVIGGGCPTGTTGTTSVVDLSVAAPKFTNGPYVGFAAMHSCSAILPDKSAFIAGGADHNTKPVLRAARLPAGAAAWQEAASPTVPRMYHSSCLVLPDGSVLTMGTTASEVSVESRLEVYKPWYMQAGVARPVITKAPAVVMTGHSYTATFSGPASVTSASLQRLSSVTHSSDPNQRVVDVPVVATTVWGQKTLQIDARATILPPGYYQLTLRDYRNIPSKSVMVRVQADIKRSIGGSAPAAGPVPAASSSDCCCDCPPCC
jgi:hypothetical protein